MAQPKDQVHLLAGAVVAAYRNPEIMPQTLTYLIAKLDRALQHPPAANKAADETTIVRLSPPSAA